MTADVIAFPRKRRGARRAAPEPASATTLSGFQRAALQFMVTEYGRLEVLAAVDEIAEQLKRGEP